MPGDTRARVISEVGCMEVREGETLIFHARARPSSAKRAIGGPLVSQTCRPLDPQESHSDQGERYEYGLIHRELWKVVVVIIVHGSSFKIAEIGSPPFQR